MKETKILNYKGLCNLFDEEPINNGGSRKRQLEKWSKKYKIEKIDGKNMYSVEPYTTKELKKLNEYYNCKKCLKPIIYRLLLSSEQNSNNEYSIQKDMAELMYEMYLINDNYIKGKYNVNTITEKLCDELKADITLLVYKKLEENVSNYYYETYKIIKKVVKNILDEMEDDKCIKYYTSFGKIIQEKTLYGFVKKKLPMTDEEISMYISLQKDIAEKKYNKEYKLLEYHQRKQVDNIVCKKLNIVNVYDLYNIILNKKGIKSDLDKLDFEDVAEIANQTMKTKLNNSEQGYLKTISKEIVEILNDMNIDKHAQKINFNNNEKH